MNVKTSLEMSKEIKKPEQLITEHIDIWTSSILAKSTNGRGSSKKYELYGISKLRELILELAVRGKLVPQDANDESASVFLEKIAVERDNLIEKGEIKKTKVLPEIIENETFFELPNGWIWSKIGTYAYVFAGTSFKSEDFNKESGTKVIKITNVGVGNFLETQDYLPDKFSEDFESYLVKQEDLVLALTRPYISSGLKVCACPQSYHNSLLNQRVAAIRHIIKSDYLYFYFRNPLVLSHYKTKFSGSGLQPNLKMADILNLPIAVPPLAEQQRIVAKVDELMLLCDQLEQQTEASIEAHATLVEVLLATLTNSADAEELAQNWTRISEHFDSLFTTEKSIDALKQTVLQLAVMGKLVPQNPEDEPASVLLEKITEEKEQLIKAKQFQKTSKLNLKKKISIPNDWISVQVGELCPSIVPNRDKPKTFTGDIPWVTLPAFPTDSWELDTEKVELGLTEEEVRLYSARLIPVNSVLMSCVGRFGLTAINRVPVSSNQQIHAFIVLEGLLPEFLCMVIKTSTKTLEDNSSSTTVSYLNKSKCESIQFGLPPLAEQQRIVTKVDELMAICDQLKEKLQQSQETQVQLTDALIDRALG